MLGRWERSIGQADRDGKAGTDRMASYVGGARAQIIPFSMSG